MIVHSPVGHYQQSKTDLSIFVETANRVIKTRNPLAPLAPPPPPLLLFSVSLRAGLIYGVFGVKRKKGVWGGVGGPGRKRVPSERADAWKRQEADIRSNKSTPKQNTFPPLSICWITLFSRSEQIARKYYFPSYIFHSAGRLLSPRPPVILSLLTDYCDLLNAAFRRRHR